jgi:WD40 repeat protein
MSPDGGTLAVACGIATFVNGAASLTRPGAVRFWDVKEAFERKPMRVHASGVASVAYAPNGERLAAGDWSAPQKLVQELW